MVRSVLPWCALSKRILIGWTPDGGPALRIRCRAYSFAPPTRDVAPQRPLRSGESINSGEGLVGRPDATSGPPARCEPGGPLRPPIPPQGRLLRPPCAWAAFFLATLAALRIAFQFGLRARKV